METEPTVCACCEEQADEICLECGCCRDCAADADDAFGERCRGHLCDEWRQVRSAERAEKVGGA